MNNVLALLLIGLILAPACGQTVVYIRPTYGSEIRVASQHRLQVELTPPERTTTRRGCAPRPASHSPPAAAGSQTSTSTSTSTATDQRRGITAVDGSPRGSSHGCASTPPRPWIPELIPDADNPNAGLARPGITLGGR